MNVSYKMFCKLGEGLSLSTPFQISMRSNFTLESSLNSNVNLQLQLMNNVGLELLFDSEPLVLTYQIANTKE